MNKLIISVSGVRGVAGENLDPAFFAKYASAFGTFVNGGKVVIGRDTRRSGGMLKQAIFAGLLATGCEVLDAGICPTPTNLYTAGQLQADGAVTITASHNPIEWNGIELAKANGELLDEADRTKLMGIYESDKIKLVSWDEIGVVKETGDAIDRHMRKIMSLSYIDEKVVSAKAPKVVIDCVNGAGAVISPKLLNRLGCEVVELNCVPDGNFPRDPEPEPDSLEELCELVATEKADIGFAHDSDADRLTIVTEKGEALSGEYTMALAADFMLSKSNYELNPQSEIRNPKSEIQGIVVNISASQIIEDIAQKHDVPVYRSKVGCGHVAQKMRETDARIGGEGTGGIMFPDVHYTADGITCLAVFVQMLAESDQPISVMVDEIPRYFMSKQKIRIKSRKDASKLIEMFIEKHSDETLDLTDGVKLIRGDSWVGIRPSGTEPVIRVFSEAPTQEDAEELCNEILNELQSVISDE